jgi:hypothetical protein
MFEIYLKALDFPISRMLKNTAKNDIACNFHQKCGYNNQVIGIWRRVTEEHSDLFAMYSLITFGEELLKKELVNLVGKNPYCLVGGLLSILLNIKFVRYDLYREDGIEKRGLCVDKTQAREDGYFNYPKIRAVVNVSEQSIRRYKRILLDIIYRKYMDAIKEFWHVLRIEKYSRGK